MRVALQPPSRSTLSRPPRYTSSPFEHCLPPRSLCGAARVKHINFCLQHSKKNPWRICITGLVPCTPCSLIQKISPPFLAPCLPFAQTKKGGWLKVMGCTRGPGINVNLNRRETRVCKTTFCEICRAYSMILRFGDVFPHLSGDG